MAKAPEPIRSASPRRANFSPRSENREKQTGRVNTWANTSDIPQPRTDRAEPGRFDSDGFIAVEAKDGQQVKNIGADIIKLAKALGGQREVAWPRQ